MPQDASRRDFLTGQAALRALAEAKQELAPPLPPPEDQRGGRSYLVHVSREAMACLFEVALNAGQYPGGADAAFEALDLVDRLEDQLTIYREHSEVSRLNRRAAAEPVVVEPGLFDLLVRAKQLSEATGGAVDVTSGPLTKVWGFHRRQGSMPSAAEIDEALSRVGSQWLRLDAERQTVRFDRPAMELNLGAIGKGHALDRAADHLESQGIGDVLIHGGSSSVLARGSRDGEAARHASPRPSAGGGEGERGRQGDSGAPAAFSPPPPLSSSPSSFPAGWRIALRHPLKPDERLAEFTLRNQALGTSGSGTQFFHYQGKRYGHILDPRSGWPADKVLAATVVAPSAALADALSTAFYVGGSELAGSYCQEHPQISALLVVAGARAGSVELRPVNLAQDQWRVL